MIMPFFLCFTYCIDTQRTESNTLRADIFAREEMFAFMMTQKTDFANYSQSPFK